MKASVQISTETGFVDDSALPTRDLVLDADHMRMRLSELFETSFEICERVRTKYRVSESLRATYRLESCGIEKLVSLRCHAIDSTPRPSGGARAMPRFNALAWSFPHDRKLDKLRGFVDEQRRQGHVGGFDVDEIELVSYAPEKAATFRCSAVGQTIGYAKIYRGDDHRPAAEKYRRLATRLRASGLRAPDLLWSDESLHQVMISPVPGRTVADRREPADWHLLGAGVAALHGIPAPANLPPFTRSSVGWIETAIRVIVSARPDVRELLHELRAVLEDTRSANANLPGVLLHGDLHAKNVLVDEHGELGFIDLDQAATGPAVAELGSLIAALRLDPSIAAEQRAAAERQLVIGYTDVCPELSSQALAWHIAAATVGERVLRAVNRVRIDTLRDLSGPLEMALKTMEAARR